MTLFVDPRAGSKELVAPLRKLGLDVDDSVQLAFGDLLFEGKGEGGKSVLVGIEFKKLEELVASLRSERLQGYQLRGMRGVRGTHGLYDFSYLLIEGELLYNAFNLLMQRRGRRVVPMPGQMTVHELDQRLHALHVCGGMMPWPTRTREDSVQWILATYRFWTNRALDEHTSHIALYEPPPLMPISDFRRTVRTLPHIGMTTSLAVEQQFKGSMYTMCMASIEEWSEICTTDSEGRKRRLGLKAAHLIYHYIRGHS